MNCTVFTSHYLRNITILCGITAALMNVGRAAEEEATQPPKKVVSMAFGWPFLDPADMEAQGGTTEGTKVTLAKEPSDAWKELQESGIAASEKDRRAILAMAGSYRVSFQFIESMGFADDYKPSRPYFSWATEHVQVLADTPTFVSLQHTLVMFFAEDADESMVIKHWRQDWSYEDRDLHVYRGNNVWQRKKLTEKQAAGTWTQAVFQVDDSPRYEAFGRWQHDHGVSRWTSNSAWRPLPRREFSVRDDYNVLAGTHGITITPSGWVHFQDNRKLQVESKDTSPNCLACEVGINRYEQIVAPVLEKPAMAYWTKTGDYWKEVRNTWADVFRTRDRFQLQKQVDGKKLYAEHFGYAAKLEAADDYDAKAGQAHAQATVKKFLAR